MKFAIAALSALGLAACATSPTQQAEIGYAKGSLGYAAMVRQDWTKAEAQLMDTSHIDADDPARLLNLAQLYRVTDRGLAARDLYNRVLEQHDMQLALADGRVMNAHDIARVALADARMASTK